MRQLDFETAQSHYDGLTPEDLQPRLSIDDIEAEKARRCKLLGEVSDSVLGLYKVDELDKEISILDDADIRLLSRLRDKILRRMKDKDVDDYEEFRDRNY